MDFVGKHHKRTGILAASGRMRRFSDRHVGKKQSRTKSSKYTGKIKYKISGCHISLDDVKLKV